VLCDVSATAGTRARLAGESHDDGSCDQAGGLDAKKKTLGATERNEEARAAWRDQLNQRDAHKLVVIDECGSNISLTPLYARSPTGQRAYGSVPRNRGKNTTLIAALHFDGMGESMIIEGAANAAAFERSVEEILAPSLTPGQIVMMDNLAAPTGKKVEHLIQDKECQVLFLPAYSPDFSPLEETESSLKTYLRRAGARTREAREEAICQALLPVTAQDAQGWFRHCGYLPAKEEA
jgi:transposase